MSELSEKFQGLGRQLTFEIYIELFNECQTLIKYCEIYIELCTGTFYVATELYPWIS